MVEHRPWLTFMTHAVLVLGVLIIAFPIYFTFVADSFREIKAFQENGPGGPGRFNCYSFDFFRRGRSRAGRQLMKTLRYLAISSMARPVPRTTDVRGSSVMLTLS